MFSSEATAADLDADGEIEILLTTFGDPDVTDSGNLMILSAGGQVLHDVPLPNPGTSGNGNGAPAAPTVADIDGDGQLEVFVQTFDHGMDVFTIPGSTADLVPWPTARGGPLRMGRVDPYWLGGLLFADGFEAGGLSSWSFSVGRTPAPPSR